MAKNKNETVALAPIVEAPVMAYIETTEPTITLPWNGDTILVSSIPARSIAYLLQYGANKTGQDAASGLIAKAKDLHDALVAWNAGEGKEPSPANHKAFTGWCQEIGITGRGALDMTADAFGKAVATAKSSARWADVMAGKMDIPGTANRLGRIERMMRDIAEATIRGRCKARGAKVPASDALETLIDALLAKSDQRALVEAEVSRRIAAEESLVSVAGDASADVMDLLS